MATDREQSLLTALRAAGEKERELGARIAELEAMVDRLEALKNGWPDPTPSDDPLPRVAISETITLAPPEGEEVNYLVMLTDSYGALPDRKGTVRTSFAFLLPSDLDLPPGSQITTAITLQVFP